MKAKELWNNRLVCAQVVWVNCQVRAGGGRGGEHDMGQWGFAPDGKGSGAAETTGECERATWGEKFPPGHARGW